jgi:hypothetical protein
MRLGVIANRVVHLERPPVEALQNSIPAQRQVFGTGANHFDHVRLPNNDKTTK